LVHYDTESYGYVGLLRLVDVGARMTSNEGFFQRRQAAAVLKHGVLRRYPLVFATMTGSRSEAGRVVFLDGYAGPGRYADGSPGSPLLAVRLAATAAGWRRAVECVFVEQNPSHFADLQRCLTKEAPPELAYRLLNGDVADHVSEVLSLVGSAPLLAFLDPFGTALDSNTLCSTLLARPRSTKTEVLLNFNLEMVSRIGGQLARPAGDQAADKSLASMDRFLGGDWWRGTFRDARRSSEPGSAAKAAQQVADVYRDRIRDKTGFQSFPVPVRRRPAHHPLFLLVLFFRADVAPWKFNDAVSLANGEWRDACLQQEVAEWRAERDARSVFGQAALPGLDEHVDTVAKSLEDEARDMLQRNESEWVAIIERNMRTLLERERAIYLKPRINELYGTTLGLAREMHVNRAWKRLTAARVAAPKAKGVKYLYEATLTRAS
jgi:three-Cys-motif partner protein